MTRLDFIKLYGIGDKIIEKKFKQIGKLNRLTGNGELSIAYKKYTKQEILKILKISLFPNEVKDFVTLGSIAKKKGLSKALVNKYLEDKKIKPVGNTIIYNSDVPTDMYMDIKPKDIFKYYNIIDTKNLLNTKDFLTNIIKGRTIWGLRKFIENGMLKPEGYAWTTKSLTPYFRKMKKTEVEKKCNIILIGPNNDLVAKSYYESFIGTATDVAIKKKILISLGKNEEGIEFFEKISIDKIKTKLDIEDFDEKNSFGLTTIYWKSKKSYPSIPSYEALKDKLSKNLIPAGRKLLKTGKFQSFYYIPTEEELCKAMGVDLICKENQIYMRDLCKHYNIGKGVLEDFIKKGYIPSLGKGYTIKGFKRDIYQIIPKEDLEKKGNFRFNRGNLKTAGELIKKLKKQKISDLIKSGVFKPVCNAVRNGEIYPHFKNITSQEFEALLREYSQARGLIKEKNTYGLTALYSKIKKTYPSIPSLRALKDELSKNLKLASQRQIENGKYLNFYYIPTEEELCKAMGVDLICKENQVYMRDLCKHYSLGESTLKKLIKKECIQCLGKGYVSGRLFDIYQIIPKKELEKNGNFRFNRGNLKTAGELIKKLKKQNISDLIKSGVFKPVCNAVHNNEIYPHFKNITSLEFEQLERRAL